MIGTIQNLRIANWRPTRLNSLLRMHWAKRQRRLRADAEIVWGEALAQGVTKAKGKRRLSLTVLTPALETPPDPDALLKSLLDAMVKAGLLLDDSPRWLVIGGIGYEEGDRGVVIELEDME